MSSAGREPSAAGRDAILARQNYRLAYWRAAQRDLGYRRFCDVTTLVGLRVENEQVFADTHALVMRWLADGVLDGLRVDHPDGLRDPGEYVARLRDATPRGWIVVEKILQPGESFSYTFTAPGTYSYFCIPHVLSGMRGTIEVTG